MVINASLSSSVNRIPAAARRLSAAKAPTNSAGERRGLLRPPASWALSLLRNFPRRSLCIAQMSGAASFDRVFEDINAGGSLRWKMGETVKDWETQHANIAQFLDPSKASPPPRVLVPLAGDCAYVKHGWDKGFDVTAVEWSSVAVETLKKQFERSGVAFHTTKGAAGNGSVVHQGERVRLVVADWDAYASHASSSEAESFDLIFDKDAYGFLGPIRGKPYAKTLCGLLKPGGFIYIEVKNFAGAPSGGPPFHISKDDISSAFVGVPIVKDFGKQPAPYGPNTSQVAHMLKKP